MLVVVLLAILLQIFSTKQQRLAFATSDLTSDSEGQLTFMS